MPALVIRGNRDRVFESARFEKVTATIPGAQEADIGVSGHLVMLERREAVERALERFTSGEGQRSWRESSSDSIEMNGSGRASLLSCFFGSQRIGLIVRQFHDHPVLVPR